MHWCIGVSCPVQPGHVCTSCANPGAPSTDPDPIYTPTTNPNPNYDPVGALSVPGRLSSGDGVYSLNG